MVIIKWETQGLPTSGADNLLVTDQDGFLHIASFDGAYYWWEHKYHLVSSVKAWAQVKPYRKEKI